MSLVSCVKEDIPVQTTDSSSETIQDSLIVEDEINFITIEFNSISFEIPDFFEINDNSSMMTISNKTEKHETRIKLFTHDMDETPSNVVQSLNLWKNSTKEYEIDNIINMFGVKTLFTREIKHHFNHEEREDIFSFFAGKSLYSITINYNIPNDMDGELIIEHFLDTLTINKWAGY